MRNSSHFPLHRVVQPARARVLMTLVSSAFASAITLTCLLVLLCLFPLVSQAQTATPTPAPTPAAPTLSGTPGATQNDLSWNTVPNATSYSVYRGVMVGGPYSTLAANLTTTTYSDTGLSNRTYDYIVRANGANSTQSVISNEVVLSTGTALFTPRQFHALSGDTKVTLTWDDQPLAASYNVYRSTDPAGPFGKIRNTTGLLYIHSGLTNGTTYYYRLTAVDAAGNESDAATTSAAAIAAVPGQTLAAPSGLTGTAGDQAASIDWFAAPQAARYNVKVSTTVGGPYTLAKTTSDLEADFHSLTNGTTYYYVVSSLKADGTESADSAPVAVTPQAPPAAPTSPACSATTGNVTLTWTASPTAISYAIKRATTTGGPYTLLTSGITALTYNDNTVTNGTHYYYLVYATNSSGTGAASAEVNATPLAAPTGLATTTGSTSLTVLWDAVTGATSYKLYRSTTSGSYSPTPLATITAPTTSYTTTGLTANTHYYFKLVALTSNSTSDDSAELGVMTSPAAITGLTGAATNTQVILNWTAVSGATYGVKRATSAGGPYTTLTSTLTSPTYTNTGLTNGTTYYYEVFAINAGGNGVESAAFSITPLAAPTGLSATAGATSLTVSWAAVTGATSYKLYSSNTSGSYSPTPLATINAPTVSYNATGLSSNTHYYFKVVALATNSTSNDSAELNAVTLPATVTGLTGSATNTQVVLNWGTVSGATYGVKRATSAAGPYTTLTSTLSTTTYTNTGLTNGTTYYYEVFAINNGGNSADSAAFSITPLAAPTGLSASSTTTSLNVSWTAVTGASSYKLYSSNTSGSYSPTPLATLTAPTVSYNATGLTANTHYYFKVVALTTNSTSNDSAELNAVTLPATVTGLTGTAGTAQVTLNWGTVTGATYGVKRATAVGGPYTTLTSTLSSPTYTNTGLTNGTTYYYEVFAINAGGNSADSAPLSLTPLAAPSSLSATAGATSLMVSWGAVTGATSYKLYSSTTSGNYSPTPLATVTAPTTSYNATGLNSNTHYYFKVVALATNSQSDDSAELDAQTLALTISGLSGTASTGQVTLNWTAVTGATYGVKRATSAAGPYTTLTSTLSSPTYTNTGLTNGTTYYYEVYGINNGVAGADSDNVALTPLAAPTGLSATAGPTSLTVSWGAVTGASSYKLYSSTTSGTYSGTPLATLTAPTVSYNATGLNSSTHYYFKVVALATNSISNDSVELNAVTLPATVTGLTGTASTGQVILNWTAVSGATYGVKRATSAGGTYTTLTSTLSSPTYTNTGLTNGTTYYYEVYAINGGVAGNDSAVFAITPLAAPTGLSASATTTSLNVSWSAVTGASSYKLYSSTTSGTYSGTPLATLTAPTVSYTATSLTANTHYYFKVVAITTNSISSNSAELNAMTLTSGVTGLTGTAGDAQVTLNWTAVSGATYGVKRATAVGGPYTTLTSSVSATTYTNTGLTNGTTYYYEVFAINAGGNSADSAPLSLTPQAPDSVNPVVTITQPSAVQSLTSLSSISGTASDVGRGVATVDVHLSRVVNSQTQYWNGTAWTTTDVVLASSSELSWIRNTNLPSGANLPPGSYTITAQAIDGAGNHSATVTRQFGVVLSLDACIAAGADTPEAPLPASAYVGKGIVNTDATNQSVSAQGGAGAPIFFSVRVDKDGNSDDMRLKGPALTDGWSVIYLDPNGADITTAVTGTGWTRAMNKGEELLLGVVVVPPLNAAVGDSRDILIHASCSDQEDVVKATATVKAVSVPDVAIKRITGMDEDRVASVVASDDDWTGLGVLGSAQSLSTVTGPGLTERYAVRIKNVGNIADAFMLHLNSPVTGWTLHLFDAAGQPIGTTAPTLLALTSLSPAPAQNSSITFILEAQSSTSTAVGNDITVSATAGANSDAVTIHDQMQSVAKIQWSQDQQTWTDVTANTVLQVKANEPIGLRAVKSDPTLDWPSNLETLPYPTIKPLWNQDGVENTGEEIWVSYSTISQSATDLKTITVECGNSLSVSLHVSPSYVVKLSSDFGSILAGGGTSDSAQTGLNTTVVDYSGAVVPNAHILFQAKHTDGSAAGVINGAGTADDIVTGNATGQVQANLTSDATAGSVQVVAILLGDNNEHIQQSAPVDVTFVERSATDLPDPTAEIAPIAAVLSRGDLDQGALNLTWTQGEFDGFNRYELHRSTTANFTPSETTLIALESNQTLTSYTDTDLEDGVTYYYKLRTFNNAEQAATSNEVSFSVPADPVYPAIQAVTLSATTPVTDYVELSWTHTTSAVFECYELHRSTTPNFVPADTTLVQSFYDPEALDYTDYEVEPNTTYYYKVVVRSEEFENHPQDSATSNEITALTASDPTQPTTQPGAITLSQVLVLPTKSIVQWTQPDGPAFDHYEVHRSTDQNFTPSATTLVQDMSLEEENEFRDEDLTPGTTYFYKVVGYNDPAQKSNSNELEVATPSSLPSSTPSAVTLSVDLSESGDAGILSWTKETHGDFAKYDVYRGTAAGFVPDATNKIATFEWADETDYIDSGLQPNTDYFYKVVTSNLADQHVNSNEVQVNTPVLSEESPVTLSLNDGDGTADVSLSWTQHAAANFDSYELHRSTSSQFTPSAQTLINTFYMPDEHSFVDSTATLGTHYYYEIIVHCEDGRTIASDPLSVVAGDNN